MVRRKILPLCALIALPVLVGCGPNAHMVALAEYNNGDPASAEVTMAPLMEKQGDKNEILYLWDDGMFSFAQGNYLTAEERWIKAGAMADYEPGAIETSVGLFSSDASKRFIGDPVEHSLAFLYTGLGYYVSNDFENALISFKKSIEWDYSGDPERQGDMAITNFMLGECYSQTGEHDQAVVAYRRALTRNEEFIPAYVGICRELQKMGDAMESQRFRETLETKASAEYVAQLDQHEQGVLVIIMSGPAPKVKKDAFLGAFRKRDEVKTPLHGWRVACLSPASEVNAGVSDNVIDHMKDQGGGSGQAVRKAVQAVAGAVMKEVPILGLFAPSTEADLRYWSTLPEKVCVAYLPAEPGLHTIRATALDKKGNTLKGYSQTWYYIPVQEDKRSIIVLISHRNLKTLM